MDGQKLKDKADRLKNTGAYADAAVAYTRYGDMLSNAGCHHLASDAFVQAAQCSVYVSPREAIVPYSAAIQNSVAAQEFDVAATQARAAGCLYFLESPPPISEHDAILFFGESAQFFETCGLLMQSQQSLQYVALLSQKISYSTKK